MDAQTVSNMWIQFPVAAVVFFLFWLHRKDSLDREAKSLEREARLIAVLTKNTEHLQEVSSTLRELSDNQKTIAEEVLRRDSENRGKSA